MGLAALSLAALVGATLARRTRGAAPVTTEHAPRKIPTTSLTTSRSSAALTQQARRALQRGDLSLAYELFSRAVEQDPANAEAWLGKGLVAQHVTEKRICFQRVLALDPNNVTAQSELQQLSG
jgi:Tfp pilus assembly protein PilF